MPNPRWREAPACPFGTPRERDDTRFARIVLGSKTNRLTFGECRYGPKITPGYWDRYGRRGGEDGLTITFCLLMFLYVV
jgi:hypothetical protein